MVPSQGQLIKIPGILVKRVDEITWLILDRKIRQKLETMLKKP